MFKKITALFLTAAMVVSAGICAYAAEAIEVERVSFSPVTRTLTVSGACTEAKNKQQILEQVINSDGKIVAAEQSAVSDGRFVIGGLSLPDSFPVGEYKITISLAGGTSKTLENAFYYGGSTKAMEILNNINAASTTSQIDGYINSGYKDLGFADYDIYSKCTSKEMLLNEFISMDLAVDASNLEVKWQKFLDTLSKNTLLTYFSDTTSADEIKKLVENKDYFNAMGMTENETYKRLNEEGRNSAYALMAADSATTLSGSYDIFKRGALLAYLKSCQYTDIEWALRNNTDVVTVNFSFYDGIKLQSDKNTVLNSTKTYVLTSNDLTAIKSYFESQAKNAYDNQGEGGSNDEGSSSSPGGGAGSSVNYGGAVNNGGQTSTDTGFNGYFSDLESVPWAYEAITALANKGVLSGVGNGLFDPNSYVTRAQFAKMICVCFGIDADGSSSFYDVTPDQWYYEYVIKLANAGIISGIGDGLFAPDSNITRQDIAVILDRLIEKYGYEIPTLTATEAFSDDAEIADYARDAMYRLQCYGILTGSENKAMPRSFATRAQAAALIYRTEVARW